MTLYKLSQYEHITASIINNIFKKIKEIAVKINKQDLITANPISENNIILTENSYPQQIKNNLNILAENSIITQHNKNGNTTKQCISNTYADQIDIPSVYDLILAEKRYNDYVEIINQIDNLCIDCADYITDHADYSDNSNNSNNAPDYPNNGNYCQACTYDFPQGAF